MQPSDRPRVIMLAAACECCGRFKARGEHPQPQSVCPHCGADAHELANKRAAWRSSIPGYWEAATPVLEWYANARTHNDRL